MGKRQPRQPVQGQVGCISALIKAFDSRKEHSTQKLLTDKKYCCSKETSAAGHSKNEAEALNESPDYNGESTTVMTGSDNPPTAKKLIDEKLQSEKGPKNRTSNAEVHPFKKNIKSTYRKTGDACDYDLDTKEGSENSFPQKLEQEFTNSLSINVIVDELCSMISQDHSTDAELKQEFVSEEKLSEATMVFINQKFRNGKRLTGGEKPLHSEEFLDALQTLNSNKELLLKLLEDSNSHLLKCVQSMLGSQAERDEKSNSKAESNVSEQVHYDLRPSKDLKSRKNYNIFSSNIKFQGRKPSVIAEDSTQIVISKPGPEAALVTSLEPFNRMRNNKQSGKPFSLFSFSKIKRRLHSAMGKDQQGSSAEDGISSRCDNGKGNGDETPSPKAHFFNKRIPKSSTGVKEGRKHGISKESSESLTSSSGNLEQNASSIYIEAKKHLSEMLSDSNEDKRSSRKRDSKSLRTILSLSEHNSSPVRSPRKDRGENLVCADKSFSDSEKLQRANENALLFKQEKDNCDPAEKKFGDISGDRTDDKAEVLQSDDVIPNTKVKCFSGYEIVDVETLETINSVSHEYSNVDIVESTDSVNLEESNVLNGSSEPCGLRVIRNEPKDYITEVCDVTASSVPLEESRVVDSSSEPCNSYMIRNEQNDGMAKVCDVGGYSEGLKLDLTEELLPQSLPLASPSSSSVAEKLERLDCAIETPERSSPVSVLDSIFADDDPVELKIQPRRIHFEELESTAKEESIHTKTFMGDDESIYEYVRKILQASGLTWDEFFIRTLSSDQILLDRTLIEEVESFPNHLCPNRELLFDCVNEVLMEVLEQCFESPWISFVKLSIRPIPDTRILIKEVWKGVSWHLFPLYSAPTLDQIVMKDMAKSKTWMDLGPDVESISIELHEAIIKELIEDAFGCCLNPRQESESSNHPPKLIEDGGYINL